MDRRTLLTVMATGIASAQLPPAVMPPPPKAKITSCVALRMLDGSFENRVRTAAEAGLQTVELQEEYAAWDDFQLKRAKRYIGSFGMSVQALAVRLLPNLGSAIAAARKLEAPYVILGGNSSLEDLKRGGELAAASEITLLIQNRSWSAAADIPQVRLLFSVYDEHDRTGNALPGLRDALEYTELIHLADFPGRTEPGTGAIDFKEVYRAIQKANYTHTVCMEYKPTTGAVASLKKAIDRFRAAVNERATPVPTEPSLV